MWQSYSTGSLIRHTHHLTVEGHMQEPVQSDHNLVPHSKSADPGMFPCKIFIAITATSL